MQPTNKSISVGSYNKQLYFMYNDNNNHSWQELRLGKKGIATIEKKRRIRVVFFFYFCIVHSEKAAQLSVYSQ